MRPRPLAQVVLALGGRLSESSRGGGAAPGADVRGASIDSRSLQPGELFFALDGEHCHGVRFAGAALDRGAPAVVVTEERRHDVPGAAIVVADPAAALGRWAAAVRQQERDSLPSVAITGSLGKTTVCGFLRQILAGFGTVHGPRGSFNNHLGVPLTILGAPAETDFLVCEVGSNRPGEVDTLTRWCAPRAVAVTTVAPAHLRGFGDLAHVAEEKLSIARHGDRAWVPADLRARFPTTVAALDRPLKTFSGGSGLRADLTVEPAAPGHYRCLLGRERRVLEFRWQPPSPLAAQQLEVALALAHEFGIPWEDLVARLVDLELPPLRGEVRHLGGVDLVLDCYNSSPVALEAAILDLERAPVVGRRIGIVGTMEELGSQEVEWHQRLGQRLAGLDDVFVLGRAQQWLRAGLRSEGRDGEPIEDDEASARRVAAALQPGDRVLFKASRVDHLETFAERVADALEVRRKTL